MRSGVLTGPDPEGKHGKKSEYGVGVVEAIQRDLSVVTGTEGAGGSLKFC